MRRFKYISKNSEKNIKEIEKEYCDLIFDNLNGMKPSYQQVMKEILLCSSEDMNEKKHNEFMKRLKPKTYFLVSKSNILFNIFFGKEYADLQPVISEFISENFKFRVCPYCGIDYVNSFKECLSYYSNFNDFLLNSTNNELKRLKGIGKITAQNILKDRNTLIEDKFKNKYSKYEDKFKKLKLKPKFHNHFTLDHIIPKAKYPLFQISLYNLIPVCYSCNTKFKGEYVLSKYAIPNSISYKLDNAFKFSLINEDGSYKIDYKFIDFEYKESILRYIKEFKIIGRYNDHLNTILILKDKSVRYNEQKILEISRQTGISVLELQRLIFGDDLFNKDSDVQLYKLKTDISEDLGILK